ncbi:hypothetical protein [Methylobacterium pseudosasicola]|uniref:Uncharacterized protein n=1 Tax=Methylobacterium pseudosasicola TaxID=582667 RepID=A0A1I4UDW9_9HYPH|nr:hypothetical protein [Methylobacterium pseudosasicola]SFM86933.1 hypothetical protein SAMN05192568_10687 [Methylobacterium pseudosasicola]
MYASMPPTSWIAPANDLERAGMVEATLDDGWFAEVRKARRADEGHTAHLRKVCSIGERVVRICFDDPRAPAFGFFAR